MPDRKKTPGIVDAVNFDLHLKKAEQFTLRNGVPVYAVNAGAEEVLSFEWVFYAGNWFEEKNLVAPSANFLLRANIFFKINFNLENCRIFIGFLYPCR